MFRFEQDGVKLWFGDLMTPAPMGTIQPGPSPALTVAVQPVSTRHRISVRYRLNDREPMEQEAVWLWTDPQRQIQYYQAALPPLAAGDRCRYGALRREPSGGGSAVGMLELPAEVEAAEAEPATAAAALAAAAPPASLHGFDMIFAVTQAAIFNAVIDNEAYADRWDFTARTSRGKVRNELHARIAPPRIGIDLDDRGNPRIQARFPFRDGTYSYWVLDPEDPSENRFTAFPVEGWELVLFPDLEIAKIPWDRLTPEVRDQLTNFNERMFAVKQVVLNLTNVNLFDRGWDVIGTQAAGIDPYDPGFIQDLKATLVGIFTEKMKSANPYVFGHLVNQESASPDFRTAITRADATFNPTGVTYSLYADPAATTPEQRDRNSLNYLLVNHGVPPPDPALGHFQATWVTNPSSAGAFVVDHEVFMRQALAPVAADLAPGKRYERQGGGLRWVLRDADRDLGKSKLPWYVSFDGKIESRADLLSEASVIPGTASLEIANVVTYRFKITTGLAKRTVHYEERRTYRYSFGVNDLGEITLSKPQIVTDTRKKTKDAPNFAWTLGSFSIGSALTELLIDKELGKSLKKALSFDVGQLDGLTLFLVMPAGRILIYSRVRFTDAGHLSLDVQYESEPTRA